MSKKSRGPNFSSNEKDILIHLITKYKDLVENKRTDAATTVIKNEGWCKLTEEFNSISSFCTRNIDQLKTCWDNIKRTTRKDKAATKKQVLLTGGGTADIPPPGPSQGQVEILLGPTLDGLDNPFDSDVHFLDGELSNNIEISEKKVLNYTDTAGPSTLELPSIETKDGNISPENAEKKVWNSWTPAALKTKVSNTLSANKRETPSTWLHRRRPKTSLQDKLLQSKIELVELTKKSAETEATLKESLLQEQLKQEKIKTEKLQMELEKIKNPSNNNN